MRQMATAETQRSHLVLTLAPHIVESTETSTETLDGSQLCRPTGMDLDDLK